MSKRVLIIPSWYPTKQRPLNGSFFWEQANFLQKNERLDIQVIYGEKKSTPMLRWVRTFISAWWKSTWLISKNVIVQDPMAYSFEVPANRRIPDRLQIRLEKQLFWKAYRSLIQTGWKPDLIHSQSGMDAGIYAHHISKIAKIPFVLIEHQVVIFHHYSRLRAHLILDAYRAAAKLGAVSHAQKRQMLMHEPECFPVVVPNLLDELQYSLRDNSVNGTFHILAVMYPHTIKGYRYFFEAIKIMKDSKVDFRFTVVGNGGIVFKEIIHELGIEAVGQVIEVIERKNIPKIFSQAHVYVCSSDFETFGISPREAMMCGLPVVSTANGGVEESITDEIGLIVPIRDPGAMANAILHVKSNYSKYNPGYIREMAISQCGRDVFHKSMMFFYQ